MAKRTQKEIEYDFKRIRHVVDTTTLTSIVEVAKAVSLTVTEVKISLSKHPRIEASIMAQLEKNKEALQAKKKAEKEALANQKKNEEAAKRKISSSEVSPMTKSNKGTADFDVGFVIDASIAGIKELEDIFAKFFKAKAKIILTSVTIRELEKMQKFNDISAKDARHILSMAAENPHSFHTVLIEEELQSPDDCIIKFCADNKDKVSLLTADKTMVLKARMYGVQAQYFKQMAAPQSTPKPALTTPHLSPTYVKLTTLFSAKRVGDKLFLTNFNNEHKSILLISNGIEYTDGIHSLKIGDDVYLAAKKPEYMTFAHYKMISLSDENNCNLVYSKRIYSESDLHDLPKAGYKSFMRAFKRRLDL